MSVTLRQLKRNVRTIPVEYAELTINITYRPSEITPALGQEMADTETDLPLVLGLERALIGWDIVQSDDDPTPVPITRAVLTGPGIGTPLLNAMWSAITRDMLVGNWSSATSGAG
jgi:hypothetical protein